MPAQTVIAYLFVLVLIYVLFRLLYGPLRLTLRLVWRTALGGLIIWVLNLIGNLAGYHIPLNLPTAMTTGLLGVPGLVVVIVLHQITT